MTFKEELTYKIEVYLKGWITIRELNAWLAPTGWDIHLWGTPEEQEMCYSTSLYIWEYKYWPIKEFREKLAKIINKN
jgi:hypothetical protein